jgi:hypothetical protein
MKVLPSACASLRDLAGSRKCGNIHVHPEIPFITIRPRIHRPMSQSIRWLLQDQTRSFSRVHKALSGLKLHGGTCHWTRRVAVTRARGPQLEWDQADVAVPSRGIIARRDSGRSEPQEDFLGCRALTSRELR